MRSHVQHQIVLVLRFLVANRTLEFRFNATFEALVPIEAVRPCIRVATSIARERSARHNGVHFADVACGAVDPVSLHRRTMQQQRQQHPADVAGECDRGQRLRRMRS